jgi:tetratricopeptide (TPR) repeat protein
MNYQTKQSPSTKAPAIAALLGISALGITTALFLKPQLGGKAPSFTSSPAANSSNPHGANPHSQNQSETAASGHQLTATLPQELEELKQAVEKDPTLLKSYLAKLDDSYHKSPSDNPAVTFAYVAALQQQRAIEPRDTDAIYALANISFDNRVFSKSIAYFSEYLSIKPEDHSTRARYASALSFTGEFDKALTELESILEKDPKHFSALAYKAITLAQKNDKVAAKQIGALAVENAPNEEAKQRITSFLGSLDKKDVEATSSSAQAEASTQKASSANPELPLDSYFRKHAIVGAKLLEIKRDGSTALLTLKDFPMSAMPPFAKDKFYSSVKEAAKAEPAIKTIEFQDGATGKTMDSVAVN